MTDALQLEHETFRLLVEAAPNGMVMVDQSGKIVLVNSQAETLFGYTREEMIGQAIEMLVPSRYRGQHPQYRDDFNGTPHARPMGVGRDLFGVRKDGKEVPIEIGLNPINTRFGAFTLASIVDITERKKADELRRARDKALHESQLKSAFVANISHELRTPLAGIVGMNELLLNSNLDDQQRKLAEAIQTSAQYLLSIINDLLDISKIEAGKLNLRRIPFSSISLVQDTVRLLADNARSKKLALITQIDYSIPDYLVGDPDRIRQVLINLLSNAIKFTEKGSVNIESRLEEENELDVRVRFVVKDTGVGISEEDTHLLFQPFTQLDSSSRKRFAGTGLGLSISRTLVELMGGKITAESSPGQGSTFSFVIPLQKLGKKLEGFSPSAEPDMLPDSRLPKSGQRLVLIVEDNPLLQQLALKQLALIGLEAQAVSTGREAVQAVEEIAFDLIFMDCNLPEMDGFEATRAIRRIDAERGQRTHIIALTASGMSADVDNCYAAGMDDYLMKPVTIPTLREKVDRWLDHDGSGK